jgi:hypothetical protein
MIFASRTAVMRGDEAERTKRVAESMRDRSDGVCADRGRPRSGLDVRSVVHGTVDPELVRRLVRAIARMLCPWRSRTWIST